MRSLTSRICVLAAAAVVAGCASSGTSAPRNDDRLAGAQIAEYTSVDLALQALRPTWRRRVREVFIDREFAGDVGVLRNSFDEGISYIELVPGRDVVRLFGPCQAPAGTGVLDTPRDPQCGTRPVIHIVLFSGR